MTSSRRPPDHHTEPMAGDPGQANPRAPEAVSLLVRSLDDPDWRVRQAAAVKLSESHDRWATELVLVAMQNEHHNLRVLNAAIRALTRNGLDVFPPLAGFLNDPDPQLRIAATLTLGERHDPRAIPAILRALDDPDSNVRFHAIEALGKLGAGEAVDSLVAIARSGSFELAAPALDALGAIGDSRIACKLLPLLDDELLQSSAVQALGSLGDEETAKALVPLLNSSDDLRGGAARALVAIWQRFNRIYRRGDLIVDLVAADISPQGFQALLESTSRADDADLSALLVVLGWVGDSRAVSALIRSLDVPAVRQAAILALTRQGPQIADSVAGCLSAGDPETKAAALAVLGRIGNRSHIGAITAGLDSDPDLAVAAIGSLAMIGGASAFEAIVPFLANSEAPVRQSAVAAIRSLTNSDLAAAIPKFLADDNPWIREAAVQIIAGSEIVRTDLLLECCSDKDEIVRCAAFDALGRIGDLRVLPLLSTALQLPEASIRAAAAQALAGLDSPDVWPLLRKALSDADAWVRYFAARSVGARRFADSIDLLLRIAESDDAVHVRVAAVDALGRLKADRAVPLLIQTAQADDPDLKHAALAALGPFLQADVLPVLLAASEAEELSTRLVAIRALGSRTEIRAIEKLNQIAREEVGGAAVQGAIDALEASQLPQAGEVLLSLTRYPKCREFCVAALSRRDASRLDELARGLEHDAVDVRRATVEALSRHSDRRALQILKSALDDPNPSVRHAAAKSVAVSLAPLSRKSET